jgi:hypothetical protein
MTRFETIVHKWLHSNGWTVLTRGWPDFLCVKTGIRGVQVMAVEVKSATDKLSDAQKQVHELLQILGVPVHVVREKVFDELKRPGVSRLAWSEHDIRGAKSQLENLQLQVEGLKGAIERMQSYIDGVVVAFEEKEPIIENVATINDALQTGNTGFARNAADAILQQTESAAVQRDFASVKFGGSE